MRLSAFDRWLTTEPEPERDSPESWADSWPTEPPPCSTCSWVDAHEPGCPADPERTLTDDND